jgi:hypothetical protein
MMRSTALWLAKILALIVGICFMVLWTGPHLNAMPDRREEFKAADDFDAVLQREADQAMRDAQIRHACINAPGIVLDGQVACLRRVR